VTGATEKSLVMNYQIPSILEPFGIKELVQSGMVAIGRGSRSISERSPRPVAVPTAAGG